MAAIPIHSDRPELSNPRRSIEQMIEQESQIRHTAPDRRFHSRGLLLWGLPSRRINSGTRSPNDPRRPM